jgi:hypothetical protein
MRWKWLILPVVLLFIVGAALPACSQVTYSAQEGKLPFTVGVGFSNFSDDWGVLNPRQSGVTLWVDGRLPHLPPKLDGLGLEVEGRDINYTTPSYLPGHRMDTLLGGPIYEWRRKGRIRPFGKYPLGLAASISLTTRTISTILGWSSNRAVVWIFGSGAGSLHVANMITSSGTQSLVPTI